ncbi:hypothetical protein [Streptomyces hoynatensis]|uniref:Uncharacterized protein n=1 Tax=Streptomyces hoynatensis TaxID=1141874 RepID=A0A3A9Z280_9ACTN|nr:hypothetical protein [Streptomyces hoynatensis]RKN42353.1 hypothetical protein D7294_13055 [Streptomyces hoynatensis]
MNERSAAGGPGAGARPATGTQAGAATGAEAGAAPGAAPRGEHGAGMWVLRWVLGGLGAAALGAGLWLLLHDEGAETARQTLTWLAALWAVHDLLFVPLVLAAGLVLRRLPGRRALRGGLLVCGSALLVALPPLLRPGAPRNPTVLSLDYPRNLALLAAAVALATAAAALLPAPRRVRRGGDGARRRAGRAATAPGGGEEPGQGRAGAPGER